MKPEVIAYFVFGLVLVLAFAGLTIHTFRRHRKERVEAPKYRMLEDDERR